MSSPSKATPRKKKEKIKAAPLAPPKATDDDAAATLLAEALGRQRISPSKISAAPSQTNIDDADQLALQRLLRKPKPLSTGMVEDEVESFPLTARAGGHDITAENWEERSKRMAALARKNEVRAPHPPRRVPTLLPLGAPMSSVSFAARATGGRARGEASPWYAEPEGAGEAGTQHARRGGGGGGRAAASPRRRS